MTKYHEYGKRLEKAFIEAREEYKAAADKLTAAEKRKADANSLWQDGRYVGERMVEKAKAEAAYLEEKANFDNVSRSVWENFNRERDRLTVELREAIRADAVVNPDAVDANAIELLKAGVCTADDYTALINRFDGNSTMIKLISKYAENAAKTVEDKNEQMQLNYISSIARNGESAVMRSWNDLVYAANICSGQAHGRGDRVYTLTMNGKWEQLCTPAAEAF